MMIIRWFISQTVRQAVASKRHVGKLLAAQRDILSPQAIEAMNAAIASLQSAIGQGTDNATLRVQMENLETAANKWLKPYPNAVWRENVEVFLVAMAVAMGIRTFFLQPFKIPTGSMQPTLYGVISNPDFKSHPALPEDSRPLPDFQIPNTVERFVQYWMHGVSYIQVVAKSDGVLSAVEKPKRFLLFSLSQRFRIGADWQTVWFPPEDLLQRAGLVVYDREGQIHFNTKSFKKGDEIIKIRVVAGDHLFVNRVTYNFRHPRRGEIIVFSTRGIDLEPRALYSISPDQYYIKRLVALGGERVQIGSDQHLIINDQRLDSSTPHFENIYNFRSDAKENEYFGHTPIAMFAEPDAAFVVQTNHFMVMGDNTRNSLDSRFFGDFGRAYVIGKSSFVYWPISSRFGFGYR